MRVLLWVFCLFFLPIRLEASDFPTGQFEGLGFKVTKGQMIMTDKNLFKYTSSALIEKLDPTKITVTISAQLQQLEHIPTKSDKRMDIYQVEWITSRNGKLKNISKQYSKDETYFKIEDKVLTIKSWISRNQLWEEQYYKLTE